MDIPFSIPLPLNTKKWIFCGLKTKGEGPETAFSSVSHLINSVWENGVQRDGQPVPLGDIPTAPAPWERVSVWRWQSGLIKVLQSWRTWEKSHLLWLQPCWRGADMVMHYEEMSERLTEVFERTIFLSSPALTLNGLYHTRWFFSLRLSSKLSRSEFLHLLMSGRMNKNVNNAYI